MTTPHDLKAFAEGYHAAIKTFGDLPETEDWITWGLYDINLTGNAYADHIGPHDLLVNAYRAGWAGNLPEPLYTFTITAN